MGCRRVGSVVLAAAALVAATAAPALGQAPAGTVGFDPNTISSASHFLFDGNGTSAGFTPNDLPNSIVLGLPSGLKWDGAAAAYCSASDIKADSCPDSSKIGSGVVDVTFAGAAYHAALGFFSAAPPQAGDLAGVVLHFREPESGFHDAGLGRVVPAQTGPELRFDRLPIPQVPGLIVTINRWTMNLGAERAVVVVKRHRVRRRHRRRGQSRYRIVKRKHTVRHVLITNPPTCVATPAGLLTPASPGNWVVQIRISYGGHQESRTAQAPCM